jgi:RNA polymerase sigma-70 factor (ECF subfamily)
MLREELEQLYLRLEKPLYNVAYRTVWHADDARELVQEGFVRLWGMRDRVDPSRVEALVYRIVLNLAASHRRRRRVWRWISLEAVRGASSPDRPADAAMAGDVERRSVREAVQALPEDLRRVVVLCECTEMTYDEIGRVLRIPAGTVGSRRHRALRLLRERLGREIDDDERRASATV